MSRHRRFSLCLASWLAGCCFVVAARGQDCPDGFCPKLPSTRQWPAAPASRQTPIADYHRAIVRVGREDASQPGASYSGTGTFVARQDDRGLVLTASHVVEQGGGRIWVDFGRGRQSASLLGRDAHLDLAALVVDHPPIDVPTIPVADENQWPHAGETVEVIGFGGGQFRHFTAQVRGYTAKEVRGNSQLVVAFQPISGDSGGAVLYQQKLAGILWGGPCDGPRQPAYETHATCCIYINQFLDGLGCRRRPPGQNPGGAANPPPVVNGPLSPAPPSGASPTDSRLSAIEQRLNDLADKLTQIKAGPAGAPGQSGALGRPGPQGVPGPAGKDADPAALAAIDSRLSALEKNLKGKLHFSLQVDSQTGKILSTSGSSR